MWEDVQWKLCGSTIQGGGVSTCSWAEQRPGGSGGILISSGDMFLTFSENIAGKETETSTWALI